MNHFLTIQIGSWRYEAYVFPQNTVRLETTGLLRESEDMPESYFFDKWLPRMVALLHENRHFPKPL